jgi:hypothetical protein
MLNKIKTGTLMLILFCVSSLQSQAAFLLPYQTQTSITTTHETLIVKYADKEPKTKDRNKAVALILWFLFGAIGIHRFYLGYTTIGLIQMFTLCGFGIWWLIDGFRLLTGSLRPRRGEWKNDL